jgi:iron complex outermembrane receptor protein
MLFASFLGNGIFLFAQGMESGAVSGTVVDARGSVLPGASVVLLLGSDVSKSVLTDANGKFAVTGLRPGTYAVQISATGFTTQERDNVVVSASTPVQLSLSLSVASVSEEVTVEAEADSSLASKFSPVKALLDTGSARTEITSQYIREFTSPVTDFSDITQAAPGTVSWDTNGTGEGQAKTYYRGFADGNYTLTWDGVPFQDSNDPTHHSWAYVPAPAISYVDFDRSPGTASDVGPANFGGSIHLFSPKLGDTMTVKGLESYGSYNTNQYLGEFNSGLFGGHNPKANFWFEGHHMTSDGYQTDNFQVRSAGTAKFVYKFSDKSYLSLVGTVVLVDSNTADSDPTRGQLAAHGDNFLMESNQFRADGSYNPLYYRYYTYHIPTNFEVISFTKEFAKSWKLDVKPYTYSYSNHQHLQKDQSDGSFAGQAPVVVTPTSAVDKLNQYNRGGTIGTISAASKYGVFRAGSWYEYTTTNRYQIKSDPRTWIDAAGIKNIRFHENFVTNSVQPFAEYQLVSIPRWIITAGIKDAYYNMNLTQFADGKIVGNLGGAPYVKHSAGYNNWLPSFEANYRIKTDWSVYADYGRGSVIPPSSVFDVTNALVAVTPKPIVANTYQGGTVVKLNRFSFDADFYYVHFLNSYSSYTPSSGDNKGLTFYYANPASNTLGFEAEGNIYLTHGLSLFLNGTVGQAKYESSSGAPATGTTPAVPATPSAWVANTPHDTETTGMTYHDKHLDIGMFNKRVGSRWDDNGSVHQAVPYDPFSVANFFFNYTLHNGSLFDQSKIKLSVNNVFDNHDVVLIGAANGATATSLFTPSPLDTLQLLPGRSIMITFQFGVSPKGR